MAIQFPPLPYSTDALHPVISKITLEFHYGKHHKTYVTKLNELIKGTSYDSADLHEIVLDSFQTNQEIFNNAAQAWNHNFYWHCMTAKAKNDISSELSEEIEKNFGSLENFKTQFTDSAKKLFGSGWTWLVKENSGKLSVLNTKDAENPMVHDQTPLLACDVWEHAYYLDYKNERIKYLDNFWKIVDWNFVKSNLAKSAINNLNSNDFEIRESQL
jgi:Fe-Mn family superoxide dismutase